MRVTHYRGIFIIRELEATDYQDIYKSRGCILSLGTKPGRRRGFSPVMGGTKVPLPKYFLVSACAANQGLEITPGPCVHLVIRPGRYRLLIGLVFTRGQQEVGYFFFLGNS